MNRYLTVAIATVAMSVLASASDAQQARRTAKPKPAATRTTAARAVAQPASCPEGRLQSGQCAPAQLAQMGRQLGIVQTQWHISYSAPIRPVQDDGKTYAHTSGFPYVEYRSTFSGHHSP
jgi:hypothetical protein